MSRVIRNTVVGAVLGGCAAFVLGGLAFGWQNAALNWWILPLCVVAGGCVQAVRLRRRDRGAG